MLRAAQWVSRAFRGVKGAGGKRAQAVGFPVSETQGETISARRWVATPGRVTGGEAT